MTGPFAGTLALIAQGRAQCFSTRPSPFLSILLMPWHSVLTARRRMPSDEQLYSTGQGQQQSSQGGDWLLQINPTVVSLGVNATLEVAELEQAQCPQGRQVRVNGPTADARNVPGLRL
jgi:hypothetical protein